MDLLSSRLETLKKERLEQRIPVSANELDILKNEIRFDLLVVGGSFGVVVSLLYWMVVNGVITPLTVVWAFGVLFFLRKMTEVSHEIRGVVLNYHPAYMRFEDAVWSYVQLLAWPKGFFQWYFSIREEQAPCFYFGSAFMLMWLYEIGNYVSGAMVLYIALLVLVLFPTLVLAISFDWMLSFSGDDKEEEVSLLPEESLLPEPTEENEKLWELNVTDEKEEKNIIEEFQPSLSGLQLGAELKDGVEEPLGLQSESGSGSEADTGSESESDSESLGSELQLDRSCLPDVEEIDSSSSSSEAQNMNFSVHHFSSNSSDDTTDNITSKLEDASKETVNIPPTRNPSSKLSTQQKGRDSDEEGLDVESFEVISREEFNL